MELEGRDGDQRNQGVSARENESIDSQDRQAVRPADQQFNSVEAKKRHSKSADWVEGGQGRPQVPLGIVINDYGETQSIGAKQENTKDISLGHEADYSSDSNGFLSSIMNAAHNAAHMISSTIDDKERRPQNESQAKVQHERDHSFTTKLESLLKPPKSGKASFDNSSENSESTEQQSETESKGPSMMLSNDVKFEPIRNSPLNTLGSGNLSLNHFEHKRPSLSRNDSSLSERRNRHTLSPYNGSLESLHQKRTSMSPSMVKIRLPNSNHLAVSGGTENLRVRRKSVGETPIVEKANKLQVKRSNGGTEGSESESESIDEEEEETFDRSIDFADIQLASSKRNKEFHLIFRKVPSSEGLIDDFSCALSKDILVQGRMYLSESHLCFNSNILGWVTNLVIPLQEVIQIEKKSTAVLFPNGMIIRTLHQKYVFATFMSRDATFDLITSVWHGVLTENGDDVKHINGDTKKRLRGNSKSTGSKGSSPDDFFDSSLDDSFSEDEEDEVSSSFSLDMGSNATKKTSSVEDNAPKTETVPQNGLETNNSLNNDVVDESGSQATLFKGLPSCGPHGHPPSNVEYSKQPNDVFITEETFSAPLGCVFLILFGSDSSKYINILKKQKNVEITEDSIFELNQENKERHYTYVKPLTAPVGPKRTKCIIDDVLVHYDLEDYILVEQITASPDVPSGNSFKVKTRMYLSWAENNSTKLHVLSCIEWTGKSWIKSAIEKGSIDGQKDSMRVMIECITDYISKGAASQGDTHKHDKRKKRKRKSMSKSQVFEEKMNPPDPKTIAGQLSDLVESIGKKVPLPIVSPTIVGTIVSVFLVFIVSRLFQFVFYSGTPTVLVSSDSFVSRITIDKKQYVVIPSSDARLQDARSYESQQHDLWKWLEDRSGHTIKSAAADPSNKDARSPEADEILRLVRERLSSVDSPPS